MSSKSSSGKQNKRKNSSVSSPKKPVTTVAALFKKQLQKQIQSNKNVNCTDEDSDNETIAFVKEENQSPYFSPPKSQNRPQQKKVTKEGGESGGSGQGELTHEKDASGTEVASMNKLAEPRKKLSRKLSLRKADQEGKSAEEASSKTKSKDNITVSAQGDQRVQHFTHKSKPAHCSSDPARNPNETVFTCDTHCSKRSADGQSSVLTGQGRSAGDVDKTALGDADAACDAESSGPSSKSRLSLKRKRASEGIPTACLSPKIAKAASETGKGKNTSSTSHATESDKVDSCAANPVFTIFKQTSGQDRSPGCTRRDSSRPSGSTFISTVQKAAGDWAESAVTTSTTRVMRKAQVSQGQTERSAVRTDGSRIKDKGGASQPASSELNTEEPGEGATENLEDVGEERTEETLYRVPYYLENFSTIMKCVFSDDYYVQLFNQADLQHMEEFHNLSEPSKKLYVRLFSRKLAWLSTAKIKYPEIADDPVSCLDELVRAKLILSGEQLDDLAATLGAMSAPDLRSLAKCYHVNLLGQQKGQIIQTLITKSRQSTVASLFGQKKGGVKEAMLKRAKTLLGPMYRLCKEARVVFVRAMMLFSLSSTSGDDDSGNGGQGQLFQMLLVNLGRVVYPAYTVIRHTRIFSSRQDLIRFEEALQLETELLGYTASRNWQAAYLSFLTVKECYDKLAKDISIAAWDSSLPEFLRLYSAGSVLVRLMSQGIEILQRRREYSAAVSLIRELLGQGVYNLDLHGYWWDRLALNLDIHLKQPGQALQAIEDGLGDPLVRTGHRLSLFLRAEAICSKPKSPFRQRLKSFVHEPLVELPKTFVEGRVLPHTLPGSRYQFITNASCVDGDEVIMCNVEQIVLDYYRDKGFPQGIHAEGSIVSTLFCLCFWEALFMDVTDAFHSPYQSSPLDLYTDAFYERRQKAIDDRLEAIESSDEEILHSMLPSTWEKHHGVMCAGITWDRFSSVKEVQGLVSCMGGKVLAGILRRYAQQPRHTRGGFPDLTLWNTSSKQLKISEVKGPGDRLSHKQMMWLDYLLKLGVDAEVCHVKPVGVKKLKPLSKQESST